MPRSDHRADGTPAGRRSYPLNGRALRGAVAGLALGLFAASCAAPSSDGPSGPKPESTASTGGQVQSVGAAPVISSIPAGQWKRMVDTGVWRPECPLQRADLRRLKVNHYTFDGSVRRGVLVVNRDVAPTVAMIFTELFEAEFPIRKMRPVEAYEGDVKDSLAADNTSAYNCRRPDQINAPTLLSPHANGRAIDINPRENPWMDLRCDCWVPTARTRERVAAPGVIVKGGLVWRLFRAQGWIWQNIDVPDYMHFDTGYPSRPFEPPR